MDHDVYVATPAETPLPQQGDGLRPWLMLAVVLLLLGALVAVQLVNARQDPSLQLPQELLTPSDPDVPSAPRLDGS